MRVLVNVNIHQDAYHPLQGIVLVNLTGAPTEESGPAYSVDKVLPPHGGLFIQAGKPAVFQLSAQLYRRRMSN